MTIQEAYDTLNVAPDSSPLHITRVYRRLARHWHPDRRMSDREAQTRANDRMREINEAFDLVHHAPLRYRARPEQRRVASERPDRLEYVVRGATGAVLGLLLAVIAFLGDAPPFVFLILPLAAAAASMVWGDRFWYWILRNV